MPAKKTKKTVKAKSAAPKTPARRPGGAETKAKETAVKAAPKSPGGVGLKVGDRAPDFSRPDETGRSVGLSDFRGRKLVIYFYPKDFTSGCTQESCDFRDNLNRITGSGAALVGVSADAVDSHLGFKQKHGLNFPLLSDPDKKMLNAYGVWQKKSLYGRSFMGIVRTTFVVDAAGRIAAVFPKVRVQGHVDAVLAALGN